MTRRHLTFLGFEVASLAAAAIGLGLMVKGNFEGKNAVWGLLSLGIGTAGFLVTRWLRRECNIRFRR